MDAIVIERSIVTSAARERVWRAITKPQNLSQWIAPQSAQFESLTVGEPIAFTYKGKTNYGTIAVVEPLERFAYRWRAHPDFDVQTLVTFTLQEVAEGTRITVTEEGFEALPTDLRPSPFDLNMQGWRIALERLSAYLETPAEQPQ